MVATDADIKLKQYVEDIEKLEKEKKEIAIHIGDIYKVAKISGFNPSIIKKIIAIRKLDPDKREEMDNLIDAYKNSLGMK